MTSGHQNKTTGDGGESAPHKLVEGSGERGRVGTDCRD